MRPSDSAPAFDRWIAANWHIYESFKSAALRLMDDRSFERYSSITIVGYMRHHGPATTTSRVPGDYKIRNAWQTFLSRMFLMEHPERRSFFDLKPSMYADDWPGPPGWPFSGTPVRGGKDPGVGPYGRGPAS